MNRKETKLVDYFVGNRLQNKTYWATVIGAWGDMLASYSYMSLFIKETNLKKFNVFYYGQDPTVKDFLEYQKNIKRVVHVAPKSTEEYRAIIKESQFYNSARWVSNFIDINPDDIILTHLNAFHKIESIFVREFECRVPGRIPCKVQDHTLLFQPYSFQGIPLYSHWNDIEKILTWLLEETDWNIILIGQDKTRHWTGEVHPFPFEMSHPRLKNLVGKTSSMNEVFKIADKCNGIITTSNCLSIWSIVSKKPAMVLINGLLHNPGNPSLKFFRDWIDYSPNILLDFGTDLEGFQKKFKRFRLAIP